MNGYSLKWSHTPLSVIGLLLLVGGSLTGVFWVLLGGFVILAISIVGIVRELRTLARASRVTPLLVPNAGREPGVADIMLPPADTLGPCGDRAVAFLGRAISFSPDAWARLDEVRSALEQYRFEPTAARERVVLQAFARSVRRTTEAESVQYSAAMSSISETVEKLIDAGALPPVDPSLKAEIINVAQGLVLREHISPGEWARVARPFVPFFTREELA